MKRFLCVLFFSIFPYSLHALTVTTGITDISGSGTQGNSGVEITNGRAVAIWTQNVPPVVETNYFNGVAWSVPIALANGSFPQAGIDNNGNALAVWLDLSTNQIVFSRFSATTLAWSIPAQISTGGFNSAPQLAVSTTGNAIAVWTGLLSISSTQQLLASTFNAATLTWSTPVVLVSGTGSFPSVSVDNQNRGVILWTDPQAGIQAITVTIP